MINVISADSKKASNSRDWDTLLTLQWKNYRASR